MDNNDPIFGFTHVQEIYNEIKVDKLTKWVTLTIIAREMWWHLKFIILSGLLITSWLVFSIWLLKYL